MRTIPITVFLLLAIAAVAWPYCNFVARSGENARETISGEPQGAKKTPVVVELFTSEGCSSCPPADELLARLEKSQPIPGVEVIALEEHVDYWNSLGWRDPFSSSLFSERQSEYARIFDNDSVYTPQMVVDGKSEFVGSSEWHVLASIIQAGRHAKVQIGVRLANQDSRPESPSLSVNVDVDAWKSEGTSDNADVLLAVTEDEVASTIDRGENAGLHELHAAVVRQLKRLGTANARKGFKGNTILMPAGDWKLANLRVVILVQEQATGRILGADVLRLGKQS